MSNVRIESDTMGTIEVPANRYWGAQTRSEERRVGKECRL